MHHELNDSGLHIGMRTLNAHLKWSGMHSVRETRTMFLFHYSKRTAYFLPKRAVGSVEEVRDLVVWIRERLPAEVPFTALEREA